jgi:hypothetical protein
MIGDSSKIEATSIGGMYQGCIGSSQWHLSTFEFIGIMLLITYTVDRPLAASSFGAKQEEHPFIDVMKNLLCLPIL